MEWGMGSLNETQGLTLLIFLILMGLAGVGLCIFGIVAWVKKQKVKK